MPELNRDDVERCVRRLPKDVRELLSKYPETLFVAGGYIRSTISGETVNDIDLFGPDKDFLRAVATTLQGQRGGARTTRLHETENAITVITQGRTTVQFITRWTYKTPDDVLASFDFTVCQAVLYRSKDKRSNPDPRLGRVAPWEAACGPLFYADLAGKRLRYTNPVREEEAGGSLMRALKYTKRGYTLQVRDLAGVMSRVIARIKPDRVDIHNQEAVSSVVMGILQEVDPSFVVDGLEISDDGETAIEGLDVGGFNTVPLPPSLGSNVNSLALFDDPEDDAVLE